MKKIILLLAAVLITGGNAFAQSAPNRTWKTKVSDALALLPAPEAGEYNRLMSDLMSTGTDGAMMLTGMLDNTNNAPVCYALSGWSAYVSDGKHEAERKVLAEALLKSLDAATDVNVKGFYIRLLQQCGRTESVPALAALIQNGSPLLAPAVEALASNGTPEAKDALTKAVLARKAAPKAAPSKTPDASTAQLATAVGEADIVSADVESALLSWLESQAYDTTTLISVNYALAKTGTVTALPAMRAAAARAQYTGEPTNATDSYIGLIKRLYATGDQKVALAEASRLQKAAAKAGADRSRISAMEIITSQGGSTATTVVKAMSDPSRAYRNALLNLSNGFDTSAQSAMQKALLAKLPKLKSAEAKADVLNYLGSHKVKAALPSIFKFMKESNPEVAAAAMWAATRIGGNGVADALADVMLSRKGAATADAAGDQAMQCLLACSGNINALASKIARNDDYRGLALLGARRAQSEAPTVFGALNSTDSTVWLKAFEILPAVVRSSDSEALCSLLEKQNSTSDAGKAYKIDKLQQALSMAVNQMIAENAATPSQIKEVVNKVLDKAGDNRSVYYPVLALCDLPDAQKTIMEGYTNAKNQTDKDNAFAGLLDLKGLGAIDALRTIAAGKDAAYARQAAEAYLRTVAQTATTAENKVLLLGDLLEVINSNDALAGAADALTTAALQQVDANPCFQGLILAGNYLDNANPAAQQAAVMAVIHTALAHKDYYGPVVTELLQKAVANNKDKDSGYQKEEVAKHLASLPKEGGFVSMFNGRDLTGWKGLVENPIARRAMKPAELAKKQVAADETMRKEWIVRNGLLEFTGTGFNNICTAKDYGNFEMFVDWKLYEGPEPDAGIYLRGTPQVQMWDTSRHNVGAEVGSGGLYNNQINPSKPLCVADNKVDAWNTFRIRMVGDRVSVWLNGTQVVDNVILENYWDRTQPIFPIDQIELQAHGSRVAYRNLYINELPAVKPTELSAQEKAEGFRLLYDGTNMHNWTGNTKDYTSEDGMIALYPGNGGGGNLYTKDEFSDFIYRFEFQLTDGANNGIGIRTPLEGDAAYVGMEIQVLDNEAPIYSQLEKYQYHGSVYGVIPAKRGFLKPTGEWNTEEIYAKGHHIRVTLNGTVITEGDIAEASKNGTMDHKEHPGLLNAKGHIGFLGHGSVVKFRNIRIKELK